MTSKNYNRVFTFYSYKGGVGRSFAMVNCATLLSLWGFKVVCVDWDIEAPGLHFYFKDCIREYPGIIDWVLNDRSVQVSDICQPVLQEQTSDRLYLITAGRNCGRGDYLEKAQAADWEELYSKEDLGQRIEALRERLIAKYDFVFVDSRTGITDLGGVCGIQLPDVLVAVFTANEQGISGTRETTERMRANRAELIYDRSALKVVPVLARFDAREEYERSTEWQRKATKELEELYFLWLDKSVDPYQMMRFTTIPYISRWTFGEELTALQEGNPSPEDITYSLENISALIAHRLQDNFKAVVNRSTYVNAAKIIGGRATQKDDAYDVYLSYGAPLKEYAERLRGALADLGCRVFMAGSNPAESLGEDFLTRSDPALSNSKTIAMLIDRHLTDMQTKELDVAFDKIFGGRSGQALLPVRVNDTSLEQLPKYLQSISWLDARGRPVESVANQILGRTHAESLDVAYL
jgi:MinD-like ATPase involved in chromosome partitioning or flagellar assembly